MALDEVLGEQEKSVQVGCIGELILGLGGKESAASDKLFSTPSIEDGAVGLPTRSATKPGGLGEPRVGLAAVSLRCGPRWPHLRWNLKR